jgi:plastocyanin
MPSRPRLAVALTAVAALSLPAAARAADVTIANKAFGPNAATVAPGQSVTWHWGDGPHNVHVTAGPEQFDSGIKTAGSSYTRAFTTAGTYSYQCDVHPSMRGQVVVGAPAAAAVAPAPSTLAPRLASVRVSRLAVVRLTSSAPATLLVRIARGARTVRRTSVRVAAGASRIPLAVRSVPLGRYRIELTALDAAGRPVAKAIRALTVTRAARARRALAPVRAPASVLAPAPTPAPAVDDHGRGGGRASAASG